MRSFSRSWFARARNWTALGLILAAVIVRSYYLQEMIASMIIFSLLFGFGIALALILILLDRVSQRTMQWAESHARRSLHHASRAR